MARVREAFGIELAAARLFEAPTLRELAAWIETARRAGGGVVLPPLMAQPRSRGRCRCRLRSSGCGSWISWSRGAAYNMPVAVRLRARWTWRRWSAALTEVVRRHEVLRTRFEIGGRAARCR